MSMIELLKLNQLHSELKDKIDLQTALVKDLDSRWTLESDKLEKWSEALEHLKLARGFLKDE